MKPFTRADLNTTVKVVKVATQDLYWCNKIGTVVDVHQQDGGCIINVRFGTMSVWFAPDSLERGALVQTWVPEGTDIDQQAEEAFRESCAKQFPIVHPESHYAEQLRPAFISGFKACRT